MFQVETIAVRFGTVRRFVVTVQAPDEREAGRFERVRLSTHFIILSQTVKPAGGGIVRLANLVSLPDVITSPGQYVTRAGETVTIEQLSTGLRGGWAHGTYANGTREAWDISGRLLPFTKSKNDILRKAPGHCRIMAYVGVYPKRESNRSDEAMLTMIGDTHSTERRWLSHQWQTTPDEAMLTTIEDTHSTKQPDGDKPDDTDKPPAREASLVYGVVSRAGRRTGRRAVGAASTLGAPPEPSRAKQNSSCALDVAGAWSRF